MRWYIWLADLYLRVSYALLNSSSQSALLHACRVSYFWPTKSSPALVSCDVG